MNFRSFYIYLLFFRIPLCNKYSDYIVTFISIHSVIIYVVFFGACMRCTRLCPLKPGVTVPQVSVICYSSEGKVFFGPSAKGLHSRRSLNLLQRNKSILREVTVGGLLLLKVLKNIINHLFSA
jgi:hypothetical protein